jgi:hypothetical protein
MRLPVVAAGVFAARLALMLAAANPVTTTHSGSSQTGSVVLASSAVAVVALGVTVLRRRTT